MISPLGIGNYIPRVTKSSRFLIDVLSAILIDTRLICQAAVGARQTPKEERAGVVNRLQRVGGNVDNTCCVLYWCITSVTTQREVANFRPSRKTLVQHNVPVIAIASNRRHRSSRTRVCKEILFADTGTEEFIQVLEMVGPKLNQKAVLFPCYDESVLLVSRFRQRLEKWYQVILPSPEIVEMLTDKIRFYTFAREKGGRGPLPPTCTSTWRSHSSRCSRICPASGPGMHRSWPASDQ